jgi:hypothetical protein
MSKTFKAGSVIAAAAVALALSGVVLTTPAFASAAKVECLGINSCKGTSECKTATNECKGHNECKGKGMTKATEKACKAKGGTVAEAAASAH